MFILSAGEEGEYQRISEASSIGEAKKRVQAQVHAVPADEQPVPSGKITKIYPASDSEEMFYADDKATSDARRRRRASCDSLSTTGSGNSRRSSLADGTVGQSAQDPRKTLVFFIGPTPTSSSLVQKQRSWETFPRPKSKRGGGGSSGAGSEGGAASSLGQLKKADSFEGHEEAVRTLVAAVQETRSQLRHHHLHHHRHHRKSKTN